MPFKPGSCNLLYGYNHYVILLWECWHSNIWLVSLCFGSYTFVATSHYGLMELVCLLCYKIYPRNVRTCFYIYFFPCRIITLMYWVSPVAPLPMSIGFEEATWKPNYPFFFLGLMSPFTIWWEWMFLNAKHRAPMYSFASDTVIWDTAQVCHFGFWVVIVP